MKTSNTILGLLLFVIPLTSWSRLTDNKVHWKINAAEMRATVDKGFHFNKEAPATLRGDIQPVVKEEQSLVFSLSQMKDSSFDLSFYVCDDANTVCEEHTGHFKIQNGKLIAATKKEAPITKPDVFFTVETNSHGFVVNNLEAALAQAAREKKMVLVDFGAPWCPSCVRLETEVFGESVFKTATKDLVKVAINVDKATMKELSRKYTIHAIPTLILMNSQGEELYRLLDYKPAEQIAQSLSALQKTSLTPLQDLIKKAETGDKASQKALAERSYNAMQFAEATKWFSKVGENNVTWAKSEINTLDITSPNAKEKKQAIATLEKWIATFPQHFSSVSWREQLAQLIQGNTKSVKPEIKSLATTNIKLIEDLQSSPDKLSAAVKNNEFGEVADLVKVEIAQSLKESYKLIDNKEGIQKAQSQVLAELGKLNLSIDKPGLILATLYYFRQSERADIALGWLEKLRATDPTTDVYDAKIANIYIAQKEYEKAVPVLKSIIAKNPDRKLGYMKQLAESQKHLKQKKEASATIQAALKLPEAKMKHNEQLVKAFKDLKSSL